MKPLLLVMLSLPAVALPPGEYLTDGGWGQLQISPARGAGQAFSINTVGGNTHTCQLDGVLHGLVATVADDGDGEVPCQLRMTPAHGRISIRSNDYCRVYCGVRAGIDGDYYRPASGCDSRSMLRGQRRFKQYDDMHDYARALTTLQPLLQRCQRTLGILESVAMRNDVALAQYHLGDKAACRRTLQPLRRMAALSDGQVREQYPPSDADNYLPVIHATRTNLRLCR